MQRQKGACLICGEPLVYLKQAEMMKCSFCGREEPSYAKCGAGHYVCDACHARQGIESIMRYCAAAAGRDPIAMLTDMMNDPYIHMHGPEHHTMVGAALMTAYRNAGGDIDLTACLAEMKKRGAAKVISNATFPLFTAGLDAFDKAYADGTISAVLGTNLTYRSHDLLSREWYYDVDVSKYIAYFIAALNHDMSVTSICDPHDKMAVLRAENGIKPDNN